jgi:hypothetical protein
MASTVFLIVISAIIISAIIVFAADITGQQRYAALREKRIDDLRACIIDYLVQVNSLYDLITIKSKTGSLSDVDLMQSYRQLNSANHGIRFRIDEKSAEGKAILDQMARFESIFDKNEFVTRSSILETEADFSRAAQAALAFEAKRRPDETVLAKLISCIGKRVCGQT